MRLQFWPLLVAARDTGVFIQSATNPPSLTLQPGSGSKFPLIWNRGAGLLEANDRDRPVDD